MGGTTPAASERLIDVRITHRGGPTALIAVDGWRLLTDPTFDGPAEGTPSAGASSWKLLGPSIAAADLAPRAQIKRFVAATN